MKTAPKARILVVDDDESGRYLKSHILQRQGYAVSEAKEGREAVERALDEEPALVLLDVKLPGISGIDACRAIKQANPSILVLQTSAAFTGRQDRAVGLAGGADSYLIEPLEPEELIATVEALLRLHEAEKELRRINEQLEEKVSERTREIAAINQQLREEIRQRIEAEDILRHAQRLESLGQLTGGIAHDFNNLLAIILGNLETARRRLESRIGEVGDLPRFIDNAYQGALRAAAVTKRLVAFSRRQTLDAQAIDLHDFVNGLGDMLRQTLGERAQVEISVPQQIWAIEADPGQLEAAILNLAINARDAMPDGGLMRLSAENIELRKSRRKLPPGPYVKLSFADNGIGMSEETLSMAFEPFFTTKDVGHGTGLGLSQVYGFVTQSGGDIEIESRLGKGTRFDILLPKSAVPPAEGDVTPAAQPLPSGTEAIILVVEDEANVRAHVAGLLRELGYRTLEAGSGAAALDILGAGERVDLVYSDIGLPGGMDGWTLAEAIAEVHPRTKVVLTTGYGDLRSHAGSRLRPLLKPVSFSALAQAVDAALKPAPHADEPASAREPPRLLVVEDEPMIRFYLTTMLEEYGFAVADAVTAKEAKELLAQGSFVGALIDIGLPDGRGDQLADEVRRRTPHLPIVIASGRSDSELPNSLRADPLTAFLAKPYEGSDIVAALRKLGIALPRDIQPPL